MLLSMLSMNGGRGALFLGKLHVSLDATERGDRNRPLSSGEVRVPVTSLPSFPRRFCQRGFFARHEDSDLEDPSVEDRVTWLMHEAELQSQ